MTSLAELDPPLAHGRTAAIHPWTAGWVLKLLNKGRARSEARIEQTNTRIARQMAIPAPTVGDLVEVDDRWGLVLERVDGVSGMQRLESGVNVIAAARQLARLHARLHESEVTDGLLPVQSEVLERRIADNEQVPPSTRRRLLAHLRDLPIGDRLCHGDFHPGNLIHGTQGITIIDWIDASRGDPVADTARSVLLFRGHLAVTPPTAAEYPAMESFTTTYIRHYFETTGRDRAQLDAWLPILAAARLREGIGEQQQWLLSQAQALDDDDT